MKPRAALAALASICVLACATSKSSEPNAVALPQTTASALGSARPIPPPASSVERVTGVAKCDVYIATYTACREKLRPIEMAGDLPVFESSRARLIMLAKQPEEERANLAAECTAMLDSIKPRCK